MGEDLLTNEEIAFVLHKASDQKYEIEDLWHLGFTKLHIIKVSIKTKLILFHGNKDTGYEHIRVRHNSISSLPYWTENGSLQNQSHFDFNQIPFNYLSIADSIYDKSNLKEIENELFDLYVGPLKANNGESRNYKLVLYKNTPIIHTLYPTKNFGLKKLKDFPLAKKVTNASKDLKSQSSRFEVKYFDNNGVNRATIIIISLEGKMREVWKYQINDRQGEVVKNMEFLEIEKNDFTSFHDRSIHLMITEDLSQIEKVIKNELKILDKYLKI